MNVKGFNITAKTNDRELIVTNTVNAGVTVGINEGLVYNNDFFGCSITLTDEEFIELVDVLVDAQKKVRDNLKKMNTRAKITVLEDKTTTTKSSENKPKTSKKKEVKKDGGNKKSK